MLKVYIVIQTKIGINYIKVSVWPLGKRILISFSDNSHSTRIIGLLVSVGAENGKS